MPLGCSAAVRVTLWVPLQVALVPLGVLCSAVPEAPGDHYRSCPHFHGSAPVLLGTSRPPCCEAQEAQTRGVTDGAKLCRARLPARARPVGSERCLPHKPRLPAETALPWGSAWGPLCSVAAPLGVALLGRGRGLGEALQEGPCGWVPFPSFSARPSLPLWFPPSASRLQALPALLSLDRHPRFCSSSGRQP